MREIKFRGKVKFNGNHYFDGEWVKGFYYENDKGEVYIIDTEEDTLGNARYSSVEVVPETIGQFTGLEDKFGRQIFEGDIVSGCEEVREVEFDNDIDCDGMEAMCSGWFISGYLGPRAKIEIIGNIHENQDLLEAKQ
jgi:uncharacterized phage protein (TIGR01671 family)